MHPEDKPGDLGCRVRDSGDAFVNELFSAIAQSIATVVGMAADLIPGGGTYKSGKHAYNCCKPFKRWFHKKWKKPNVPRRGGRTNPNATPAELDEAYRDWVEEGHPSAD
jgi:hypothetical protein